MSRACAILFLVTSAAASSPLNFRRPTRAQLVKGTATASGLALGWSLTPTMTTPAPGGVRTAEAWRRKIMSRRPIPLEERAPQILAIALTVTTAVEYAMALREHGPVGALDECTVTIAARHGLSTARSCAARAALLVSDRMGQTGRRAGRTGRPTASK